MAGAPPPEDQSKWEMGRGWAELSCPGVAFENLLRLRSCDTQDAKWKLPGHKLVMDPGSWLDGPATAGLGGVIVESTPGGLKPGCTEWVCG